MFKNIRKWVKTKIEKVKITRPGERLWKLYVNSWLKNINTKRNSIKIAPAYTDKNKSKKKYKFNEKNKNAEKNTKRKSRHRDIKGVRTNTKKNKFKNNNT
jgi:hypothetical protein